MRILLSPFPVIIFVKIVTGCHILWPKYAKFNFETSPFQTSSLQHFWRFDLVPRLLVKSFPLSSQYVVYLSSGCIIIVFSRQYVSNDRAIGMIVVRLSVCRL